MTLMLLMAFSGFVLAIDEKEYGDVLISEVHSVYDGDTIRVSIQEFPEILGENIGIRLAGIDAPEMKDNRPKVKALALQARNALRQKIEKGHVIKLKRMRRDKYFRIVGDLEVDGENMSTYLIHKGLAKPYDGGHKSGW